MKTQKQSSSIYFRAKRLFDIVVALIALSIFLLPMLIVALLVRIKLGKPILFKQTRTGLHGELFTIYKFRTMRESVVAQESDARRLDSFGQILRKYSFDELPQLLNVLNGKLSVVGPRPLLPEYLPLYSSEQARRHLVKPGVTGWAQINGRNALSWQDKFDLDVWYVDNVSFLLDCKIILLTITQLFLPKGINQPGQVTAEKFRGNIS